MDTPVPSDFAPLFRSSPFLDLLGPLYGKGMGAQLVVGFHVQEKHTNARGNLHGGVLTSIADVTLGYSLATATPTATFMITASLTLDFSGSARLGDWIESSVDFQKLGSRLAFANAYLSTNGQRIARASGVFLVMDKAA